MTKESLGFLRRLYKSGCPGCGRHVRGSNGTAYPLRLYADHSDGKPVEEFSTVACPECWGFTSPAGRMELYRRWWQRVGGEPNAAPWAHYVEAIEADWERRGPKTPRPIEAAPCPPCPVETGSVPVTFTPLDADGNRTGDPVTVNVEDIAVIGGAAVERIRTDPNG